MFWYSYNSFYLFRVFICGLFILPIYHIHHYSYYIYNSFNLGTIRKFIKADRSYVERHWKPAFAESGGLNP